MAFEHKSVLLEEVVNGLNIKPDGIYVDGTLGGGGHAFEVCKQLSDKGSFIAVSYTHLDVYKRQGTAGADDRICRWGDERI